MARLLILTGLLLGCLTALSGAALAQGRSLVIDLAEDHIDITTGFNGAHLVLFGVREQPGDIAIVVRGPERTLIVRKKEQILGAWLNRRSMTFRKVPSYYDYAVSAPEKALLSPEDLREYGIGLNALNFEPDYSRRHPELVRSFQEALVRTKQLETVYPRQPKKVRFLSQGLFRAEFYVPANVPPGLYEIETFLIADKRVIETAKTQLRVGQVGFSARLFDMAYSHSFLYGLLCVFIAIMSGFGVNMLRR